RCAYAHQIAGLLPGQSRHRPGQSLKEKLVRLAHTEAADGVSRKVEVDQLSRARLAQIAVDAPLDDGKEGLIGAAVHLSADARPGERAPDGLFDLLPRRRIRGTLVKDHRDVGAESLLDAHRLRR